MKTLLLLRHAKSSWEDPALDDFDRPLNPRGRRASPRVARAMRDLGLLPDRVIASPALRSRQTWALAGPVLEEARERGIPVTWEDSVYAAEGAERLLQVLQAAEAEAETVLLLGHNPALEDLAHLLLRSGSPGALKSLQRKFPTAALAVIALEIEDWSQLAPAEGHLRRFVLPRELAD